MSENSKDPLAVVMAFSNAMEQMDFETGLKYASDDLVYINSPNTEVSGPQGVRQVLEPFFAPIEENEFIIKRRVAQDKFVVLERLDRHRVPQGWFELPVTGVYEVRSGKIVYWREYFDYATIANAMENLLGANQNNRQ